MAGVVGVIALIAGIPDILDGIHKSKAIIKKYVYTSSSLRVELVTVRGKLTALAGILRGLQLECEVDESDNGRLQSPEHVQDPLPASEKAAKTVMGRSNQVVSIGGVSLSFRKLLDKETSVNDLLVGLPSALDELLHDILNHRSIHQS